MLLSVLASWPFYLNDLFFHYFQDQYLPFILVFYFTDIWSIAIVYLATRQHKIKFSDVGFRSISFKDFLTGSVLLTLMGVITDQLIGHLLRPFFTWRIYHFPEYPNFFYRWFDLTFGLLMVAVAEELIFRGLILEQLKKTIQNKCGNKLNGLSCACSSNRLSDLLTGLLSVLLFGAIHWGSGMNAIINSAIWALAPTYFSLRYRNIYPCIVAHYLTDFVSFY